MNITIGQNVAWTQITQKGSTLDIKRCDGIVQSINETEATAIIATGNQRRTVGLAILKHPNEYTDIQDLIEAMKKRHQPTDR